MGCAIAIVLAVASMLYGWRYAEGTCIYAWIYGTIAVDILLSMRKEALIALYLLVSTVGPSSPFISHARMHELFRDHRCRRTVEALQKLLSTKPTRRPRNAAAHRLHRSFVHFRLSLSSPSAKGLLTAAAAIGVAELLIRQNHFFRTGIESPLDLRQPSPSSSACPAREGRGPLVFAAAAALSGWRMRNTFRVRLWPI